MPRQTAPADAPPKDEVAALARGLAVLQAIASAEKPLSNRALADVTGIPKATVSRLAATLLGAGYLRQDEDSELFSLGPTLLDLSSAYLRDFDMRTLARPHFADLAEYAGASVHMGLRDGCDILMIESVRPRSAVVLSRTGIGTRMNIATSASGRAYYSALGVDERKFLSEELRAASPKGWTARKASLDRAVVECTGKGYCSSFEEWHPDINALGFTLRGPRGELYAVSCGGPAYRLTPELMHKRVAPKLLQTQRAVARAVGTSFSAP